MIEHENPGILRHWQICNLPFGSLTIRNLNFQCGRTPSCYGSPFKLLRSTPQNSAVILAFMAPIDLVDVNLPISQSCFLMIFIDPHHISNFFQEGNMGPSNKQSIEDAVSQTLKYWKVEWFRTSSVWRGHKRANLVLQVRTVWIIAWRPSSCLHGRLQCDLWWQSIEWDAATKQYQTAWNSEYGMFGMLIKPNHILSTVTPVESIQHFCFKLSLLMQPAAYSACRQKITTCSSHMAATCKNSFHASMWKCQTESKEWYHTDTYIYIHMLAPRVFRMFKQADGRNQSHHGSNLKIIPKNTPTTTTKWVVFCGLDLYRWDTSAIHHVSPQEETGN